MSLFNPQHLPKEIPTIDASQLEVIIESAGDTAQSILEEIMSDYQLTVSNTLAAIQSSIESKNIEAIQKSVHKIKGSSANLGFARIVAYCLSLEQAAGREGQAIDYHQCVSVVRALCKEAMEGMRARIEAISL